MIEFFNTLLYPIKLGEAWVMYAWHWLFAGMGLPTGWSWALSIVGLTVIVRILLIPLFVKQIHSSRRMQLIQPEMQKIQKKYKGKRDPESQKAQQAEIMDLYRRTGTNPFSSCLPILIQSPFFFALFQLLNNLKAQAEGVPGHDAIGPITQQVAAQIESSSIFGAKLSDHFLGSTDLNTKILTAVLIVMMSATTFITQHQLMRRNMPQAALDNPFAKQQKVLLYLMPLFFAISGINFPIGVLLYWLTTNLWTMGQQFYVIRNMPAPGSAAEQAQRDRMKRKGKTMKELVIPGLGGGADDDEVVDDAPQVGQRQQPKGKKRAKASTPKAVATPDPTRDATAAAPDPTRDAPASPVGSGRAKPSSAKTQSGAAKPAGKPSGKVRQNPNRKPANNPPGSGR
ncbi:MAG: membrane protein insertase YidC [Terracoccus sp.]